MLGRFQSPFYLADRWDRVPTALQDGNICSSNRYLQSQKLRYSLHGNLAMKKNFPQLTQIRRSNKQDKNLCLNEGRNRPDNNPLLCELEPVPKGRAKVGLCLDKENVE